MEQLAGHPYWELSYDKSGTLTAPEEAQFLDELEAAGVRDLFVLSHGWGNSEQAARHLYTAMFGLISEGAASAPGLGPIGYAGIFWPSLWFPDPPVPDIGGTGDSGDSGAAPDRPESGDGAVSGAAISAALAPSFDDPGQRETVARLGQLIDAGTAGVGADSSQTQQERLDTFHSLMQTLVTTRPGAVEDSGEGALVDAADPQAAYTTIATAMGDVSPSGSAQGLGDVFGKVWNGARDALRAASYYEMKGRAGDIGRSGLGPLLERLHQRGPSIRVHLVGHSFGARLVSFALAGIDSAANSPVASLVLVQGAFSHWSFTGVDGMPFGRAGALSGCVDRVHGPMLATFSEYDWAVGRWYPKASLLARDDSQGRTDPASQWGGLGCDGFQGVHPSLDLVLKPAGAAYPFQPGSLCSVDGSEVIADVKQSPFAGAHSDIEHPEVAWLILSAAAAADTG